MFGKIIIRGTLEVVSGLHIGTSDAFSAIGAIDSPVIRDAYTQLPMIPGSSLKGKIRSLLSKSYPSVMLKGIADEDIDEICRMFGSAKKNSLRNSRLIFADTVMNNWEELKQNGVQTQTEAKHENTINRLTSEANPRQIERVIRGAKFPIEIIYNAEEEDEIIDDIKMLKEGITLLTYDYLGGNGSRGYGKVMFHDLSATLAVGKLRDGIMEECNKILSDE